MHKDDGRIISAIDLLVASSWKRAEFSDLVGELIANIFLNEDTVIYLTMGGKLFKQSHYQDCCENVYIQEDEQEINSLLALQGQTILEAEEVISESNTNEETSVFYKLKSQNVYSTICWRGESNGCYSHAVSMEVYDARLSKSSTRKEILKLKKGLENNINLAQEMKRSLRSAQTVIIDLMEQLSNEVGEIHLNKAYKWLSENIYNILPDESEQYSHVAQYKKTKSCRELLEKLSFKGIQEGKHG